MIDQDNRTSLLLSLSLALTTAFLFIRFGDTSWFLPLCLLFWGGACIFRLLSLTCSFSTHAIKILPQKLIYMLGLSRQIEKEHVLSRIFLNPLSLIWGVLGISYLCMVFFSMSAPSLSDDIRAFWSEAGVEEYSGFLIADQFSAVSFPLLCGLLFVLTQSYGAKKENAYLAAFISSLFLVVYISFAFFFGSENGESGFLLRSELGGFWLASLPYILGALVVSVSAFSVMEGLGRMVIPFLFLAVLMISIGIVDLYVPVSGMTQSVLLASWVSCGFMHGYVLQDTQKTYSFYAALKQKLDTGTKIEHS